MTTTTVPTDAKSILTQFLDAYGLSSLANWAWDLYTKSGGGDLGMSVVNAELPQQQAFITRFPAIAAREKAGLPPITPTDYINYETGLRQALISTGISLPTQGQDFNDVVDNLLTKDVSLSEVVNDRIGKALTDYAQAPDDVKAAFNQVYGVNGASALATHLLDPNLAAPQIAKLDQAAQLLGTGQHYGVNLGVQGAINLAGQDQGASGAGVSQFQKLAQEAPLFNTNFGEDPNLTQANQGVGAAFGTDAAAAQEVQRRLAEREAAFSGNGGAATTSTGVIGLGPTPQT